MTGKIFTDALMGEYAIHADCKCCICGEKADSAHSLLVFDGVSRQEQNLVYGVKLYEFCPKHRMGFLDGIEDMIHEKSMKALIEKAENL